MTQSLKKTYTITFGDVAENHARMQKVGILAEKGYSCQQLEDLGEKLITHGLDCEIVRLDRYWQGDKD